MTGTATEQLLYWRRTIEVVALVVAIVVIATRWHDAPPTVIAALLTSLAVGQSPISNVATTLKKTIPPPPPPPPDES